ncbi:acyl carrier protein [Actinocorallia herbida]|uniref:Acyl carrier protein n=1 Tax=Actinocorallia herbida TaxID=58109 RepID=A0A3N1DBB9_9ACTN|nr:acyl carrier protein [Actinocorallia herbida]ROO90824.1 acyl carrier protein [Actinocorallia herbida]
MRLFRRRDVRRSVTSLIGQIRPGLPAAALTGGALLREDLGLDSLATVGLAVRLHDELGVDLAALAERAASVLTVDDLVTVLEELTHAAD